MTTLLLLHGNAQVAPKYQAALPGAQVVVVSGLSVNEYAELGKQSIVKYLEKAVGFGKAPSPIIVAAFSAGGFALREFLKSSTNRVVINAAIFLDSTYGAEGGACSMGAYDGVVAYANGGGLTVISYSSAHPAPGVCASAIKAAAPSVELVPSGVANHGAQLSDVGPGLVSKAGNAQQARWSSTSGGLPWGRIAVAAVAGLILWRWLS